MNRNDDKYLAHYGVLGMKWGVRRYQNPDGSLTAAGRKKYQAVGGRKSSKKNHPTTKLSKEDRAVLKAAGFKEQDSEVLRAKYGPEDSKESLKDKWNNLSDQQKKVYINAAITAGLGLAIVGYAGVQIYKGRSLTDYTNYVNTIIRTEANRAGGLKDIDLNKFSTEAQTFKPGHIFKRISTKDETSFIKNYVYASPSDKDANRYKAVLPIFWKQWGLAETEGFVVNIQARKEIKVPSQKHLFDLFEKTLSNKDNWENYKYMYAVDMSTTDPREAAKKLWYSWGGSWAHGDKVLGTENKLFTDVMNTLRSEGYNAVMDINDRGKLSENPLMFLDAVQNLQHTANDRLTLDDINKARRSLIQLAHMLEIIGGIRMDDNRNNDYLAHYGVIGMKWGVRRYQNPDGSLTAAGRKRYSATSSDSNTTKRVKKDLANLSSEEFRKKYSVSKSRYMKRVDRYGDPYMNSPLAKIGKAINKEAKKNEKRYVEKASKKEEKKGTKEIDLDGDKWVVRKDYELPKKPTKKEEKAVKDTVQTNDKFRKELKELDLKAYQRVANYEKTKGIDFIEKFTKDWGYDIDLIRDFTPKELESFLDEMKQADKTEDFLAHYGVLGMKWGVRRYQNPDGSLTDAGKRRRAKKETATLKKQEKKRRRTLVRNRSILPNKELDELSDRIKRENQLLKSSKSEGKNFTEQVISTSGNRILTTVLTGAGIYAVRAMLQNEFDPKEASEYLKPKKKK